MISSYHSGVEVAQHWGAAITEVPPGVDMEPVEAGAQAGDGALHLDGVAVQLSEHDPSLDGVSLQDGHSRLGLNVVDWMKD